MLNELKKHSAVLMDGFHLKDVLQDEQRSKTLRFDSEVGVFDFSHHLINDETIQLFSGALTHHNLFHKRDEMIQGVCINATENRSVQHMALRSKSGSKDIQDYVDSTLDRMKVVSDTLRFDVDVKDIIHIGIGGSDFGPKMICEALSYMADGPNIHFLSTIDGGAVQSILNACNPETTAVIVVSKTFTTQETMLNFDVVREWAPDAPVYAVTGAIETAQSRGVLPDNILPLQDWIGGRFSMWGAAGISIAISIGYDRFLNLLSGANAADSHFMNASSVHCIPVMMACLSYWYHTVLNYPALAIVPYVERLKYFPDYMQQLDMESNGKAADYPTGPIVFGGVGTQVQHAFFQHIHQSPTITPVDFITNETSVNGFDNHHTVLNANAMAQAKALAIGADNETEPHRHFSGNRPSTMITLNDVTPYTLGYLCATYEHKIFVQGALLGINSFDQYGVELGKHMAKDLLRR